MTIIVDIFFIITYTNEEHILVQIRIGEVVCADFNYVMIDKNIVKKLDLITDHYETL